jgi:triosephosphate isomerase
MERIPMIAGNWKMNMTVDRAVALVKDMLPGLNAVKGVDRVICPPFLAIKPVADLLKKSSVSLGAQNMYFEEKGAFTGEISPNMIDGRLH